MRKRVWFAAFLTISAGCGPSGAKKVMVREALAKIQEAEKESPSLRQMAVDRASAAVREAIASGDPASGADARINLDLKSCLTSLSLFTSKIDGFDGAESLHRCETTLSGDL